MVTEAHARVGPGDLSEAVIGGNERRIEGLGHRQVHAVIGRVVLYRGDRMIGLGPRRLAAPLETVFLASKGGT